MEFGKFFNSFRKNEELRPKPAPTPTAVEQTPQKLPEYVDVNRESLTEAVEIGDAAQQDVDKWIHTYDGKAEQPFRIGTTGIYQLYNSFYKLLRSISSGSIEDTENSIQNFNSAISKMAELGRDNLYNGTNREKGFSVLNTLEENFKKFTDENGKSLKPLETSGRVDSFTLDELYEIQWVLGRASRLIYEIGGIGGIRPDQKIDFSEYSDLNHGDFDLCVCKTPDQSSKYGYQRDQAITYSAPSYIMRTATDLVLARLSGDEPTATAMKSNFRLLSTVELNEYDTDTQTLTKSSFNFENLGLKLGNEPIPKWPAGQRNEEAGTKSLSPIFAHWLKRSFKFRIPKPKEVFGYAVISSKKVGGKWVSDTELYQNGST